MGRHKTPTRWFLRQHHSSPCSASSTSKAGWSVGWRANLSPLSTQYWKPLNRSPSAISGHSLPERSPRVPTRSPAAPGLENCQVMTRTGFPVTFPEVPVLLRGHKEQVWFLFHTTYPEQVFPWSLFSRGSKHLGLWWLGKWMHTWRNHQMSGFHGKRKKKEPWNEIP